MSTNRLWMLLRAINFRARTTDNVETEKESSLMRGAGIEPCRSANLNLMMVHDFGHYRFRKLELLRRHLSSTVLPNPLPSTPVMEIYWRRCRRSRSFQEVQVLSASGLERLSISSIFPAHVAACAVVCPPMASASHSRPPTVNIATELTRYCVSWGVPQATGIGSSACNPLRME